MHIPKTGWFNGAWNWKESQFRPLGEMVGLSPSPSPGELQEVIERTLSAKLFAESVQPFLEATGMDLKKVMKKLEEINHELGVMELIPFTSLKNGWMDPSDFQGVAIWPAGTVPWSQLRLEQILLSAQMGAKFERVVVLGSSRVCSAPADRRHPDIRKLAEGNEPDERKLMRQWTRTPRLKNSGLKFEFPKAAKKYNDKGNPLSLQEQLNELILSGEFDTMIGTWPVYVPANVNALYVPLHVLRILGLGDVCFSQAAATTARQVPLWLWPGVQDLMTTPSGNIRLWKELIENRCITR